jgi:hypothetical protein
MRVRTAISLAFGIAAARYPHLPERWVSASIRIGSQLPHSILMASIQRIGRVDMLLRAMEDELDGSQPPKPDDIEFMALDYQSSLSEDWIGSIYEITRLRKERNLVLPDSPEVEIARILRLLRMPLDKHEIANGPGLKVPLAMERSPPSGEARDRYVYDRNDPTRGHIMPTGVSARGSLMWHAIDGATLEATWFERRTIADALLDAWAPVAPSAEMTAPALGE